ncbi:hypothetical protein TPHV1_110010 [Treponema phagedenis]|uniref:Uncharacterized protein n=1 Tax=Treponema phagedenis TaxID=162 RepID=A0A0B7GQB1_TREPH|nr:hypothetical protein TPHV1_110010 [Treponema phagedenis]
MQGRAIYIVILNPQIIIVDVPIKNNSSLIAKHGHESFGLWCKNKN